MLVNIQPPPGFFSDITDLDAGEKWVRGDKVRFHLGRLKKLGGWQKLNPDDAFEGKCRYILAYQDLDLNKNIWFGTHTRAYLFDSALNDITPLDQSGSLTDPFETQGIGESTIEVTDAGHGRTEGDVVIFSGGPWTIDGVTINNGEYTVLEVLSTSVYVIQGSSGTASAGNTGGTAAVTFQYLLSTGQEYASFATGWGAGTWGSGTWGSPRLGTTYVQPSIWSASSWGEDVIACRRNGSRVFYYDTSVGGRMTPIERVDASTLVGTGTYPRANAVSVSSERIMVLFGAETSFGGAIDPLMIRWSDRENYQVLDDLDTNLAGSFRLQAGNEILAHEVTKNGYVVLTDVSAHYMQFLGFPFVFGFTPLGGNCGVVGPNGSAEHNGVVYWMGKNHNFYRFDGRLETLTCPVQETVADEINTVQGHLVVAGINSQWHEVWWVYPIQGAQEIARYVIYNWKDNAWYTGTICRTYLIDHSTFDNPIAACSDGYLYFHEIGTNADGSAMYAWAETGEFQLADGDRLVFMDTLIPDAQISGSVNYTIKTKRYPLSAEEFTKGPYTALPTTEKIKMRARGRQWAVKMESNGVGHDFYHGKLRVNIQPDGGR